MPWKETCAMDEKVQMMSDWLKKEHTISELGEHYQVSRKTVHKWINRFKDGGVEALKKYRVLLVTIPMPLRRNYLSNDRDQTKTQRWGPKKIVDPSKIVSGKTLAGGQHCSEYPEERRTGKSEESTAPYPALYPALSGMPETQRQLEYRL